MNTNSNLTANQMQNFLKSSKPEIMIFDLDGTLTNTNLISFYLYYIKSLKTWIKALRFLKLLTFAPIYIILDLINRNAFQSIFFRNYLGINQNELKQLAKKYVETNFNSLVIKPNVDLLNGNNTSRKIILSTNLLIIIENIAPLLGVSEFYAQEFITNADNIIIGIKEKNGINFKRNIFLDNFIPNQQEIFGLGDNKSDFPFLKMCKYGFIYKNSIYLPVKKSLKNPKNKTYFFEKIYFQLFVKLTKFWFFNLYHGEIKGQAHIEPLLKENKPFIIAANHASYFDWMVLYIIFNEIFHKPVYFLAKNKLYFNKIMHPLIKVGKAIKVYNEKIDPTSMKHILNAIKKNSVIGIFPEGTRSYDGSVSCNVKPGVIKLSAALGIPVIPIGLSNFHKMWPRRNKFPRLNKTKDLASINIGKPVYYIDASPKIIQKTTKSLSNNKIITYADKTSFALMESINKLIRIKS